MTVGPLPCLIGILFFVFISPGSGQEFRAEISGEVADPSGAAVAGAKVIAHSVERSLRYETVTNSAGR